MHLPGGRVRRWVFLRRTAGRALGRVALGWCVVDPVEARWAGDRGRHAALCYGPGARWATAVVGRRRPPHLCGGLPSLVAPAQRVRGVLDADGEERARLQAAHRHAVDHALSSLPFQRDHRVLFVASDRLEDDWTHHWLFAIACAPNGKWERLALSLRLAASEDAYTHAMGAFMEALLETKRLERFFRPAPVGRPRQRL